MKKISIFILFSLVVYIIYKIGFELNPDIEIKNILLDDVIRTPEQAIEIAEEFTLRWDKRAKANSIVINYLNKQDLFDQTPEFIVYGGWMKKTCGFTIVTIHGNTIKEFYAREAHITASMGTIFPKDMIFPSTEDVVEVLDIAAETLLNWRELDNFVLTVRPKYENTWEFGLNHQGIIYSFEYDVLTENLEINNQKQIKKNHLHEAAEELYTHASYHPQNRRSRRSWFS
ncbi:MAG: hypothetical protein LBS21_04085 [Clostridiales bacterium]|jgi:hypothetical protein|nr:hypothetical protein [Clostridiales bacterium]